MSDRFIYTTPNDPLAAPLIAALADEYQRRYGNYWGEPASNELSRYPAELFTPPHGNFVILQRDDIVIGGGAFKRYDTTTAELKRMWTDIRFRRQGLARKVLKELEQQALRQGYTRMYLTTGFRQPEASSLYLHNGYTALYDTTLDPEVYGSLPFEKDLVIAKAQESSLDKPVAGLFHGIRR